MSMQSNLKERVAVRLKQRHRAEYRFKIYGVCAIGLAAVFLAVLFITIVNTGSSAFKQTKILLHVDLAPDRFGGDSLPTEQTLEAANFHLLINLVLVFIIFFNLITIQFIMI